jgi:serine/threonine protein kinase
MAYLAGLPQKSVRDDRWCAMARRRVKTASPTLGALAGLSEFTDIEPIAAGGTSQVFRARQPAMDRLVAIKILGLAAADPQVRVRFERELVITGHLSQHRCSFRCTGTASRPRVTRSS